MTEFAQYYVQHLKNHVRPIVLERRKNYTELEILELFESMEDHMEVLN